jgi:hypothetical protein
MIRINLLKETEPVKSVRAFPVVPVAIAVGALIIIGGGAGVVLTTVRNRPKAPVSMVAQKKDTLSRKVIAQDTGKTASPAVSVGNQVSTAPVAEAVKPLPVGKNAVAAKEPPKPEEKKVSASPNPAEMTKGKFSPSTHTSDKVVEDVVRDRNRRNVTDLLSLAYKEMSRGEKINYELAFTKKVFELLTIAVPEGIEFSSLTIDSFTVVKAVGLGPSRELVGRLFGSLRDNKLVLRERPISSIRPVGMSGYRFEFSCEAAFGFDTTRTYRAMSELKPHEGFNGMLRSFSTLAARDGIAIHGGLERTGTEKATGFRRYSYRLSGSGAYRDFVKLVLDLQTEHLPCSFNKIQLKARNDAKISIEADIVFTLLD